MTFDVGGSVTAARSRVRGVYMVLGPRTGPLTAGDLAEAYPWPDQPRWVRAMMVTSLDGAFAGGDGRSRSLSSTPDRQVMAEARRLSDVVLVGAQTIRAERYRPMRAKPEHAAARAAAGLAPAPVIVVVSASLELPWDEPMFAESAVRPIVVTVEPADPQRLRTAAEHADLLVHPGGRVELPLMLDQLGERGLRRVVCEGGPRLLAKLVTAELVDEVDLSVAPLMPGGGQWSTGSPSTDPARFTLGHVIEADGFLFNRYLAVARR